MLAYTLSGKFPCFAAISSRTNAAITRTNHPASNARSTGLRFYFLAAPVVTTDVANWRSDASIIVVRNAVIQDSRKDDNFGSGATQVIAKQAGSETLHRAVGECEYTS